MFCMSVCFLFSICVSEWVEFQRLRVHVCVCVLVLVFGLESSLEVLLCDCGDIICCR